MAGAHVHVRLGAPAARAADRGHPQPAPAPRAGGPLGRRSRGLLPGAPAGPAADRLARRRGRGADRPLAAPPAGELPAGGGPPGRRVLGAGPGAGNRRAQVRLKSRVAGPAALPRRSSRHGAPVRHRLRAQLPGRHPPPRHCRGRGAPPHVAGARPDRRRHSRRDRRAVLRLRLPLSHRGRRRGRGAGRRRAAVRHVVRRVAADGLRLGHGGGLHAAHPLGRVEAPLPVHDRDGAARPPVPAVPADERAGRHHRAGVLDRQHRSTSGTAAASCRTTPARPSPWCWWWWASCHRCWSCAAR